MPTQEEVDHLYAKLVEVLGQRDADTLMKLLRIPGWRPPALRPR